MQLSKVNNYLNYFRKKQMFFLKYILIHLSAASMAKITVLVTTSFQTETSEKTYICILDIDNNKSSFDFIKWKQSDKLRILCYH